MPVKITRTEYSADDLRREAARARDPAAARRMLAIAMLLEGASRADTFANLNRCNTLPTERSCISMSYRSLITF